MSAPRVFQEGAVTICVSPDGFRVRVGHVELSRVASFLASPGSVEIGFEAGGIEVEEQIRLARSVPWIKVK